MLSGFEWLDLVTKTRSQSVNYLIFCVVSVPISLSFILGFQIGFLALVLSCALTFILSFVFFSDFRANPPLHILFGVFYIGLSFACLIWLRNDVAISDDLPNWFTVLFLFILVWTTDTAAYFSGKLIGGAKMAPKISPNKTWAGLIGAIIATTFISFYVAKMNEMQPLWLFILLGVVLPVVAQMGDIFISFLKRRAGLKDTGHILPGHGGILDRFDGVLSASLFYSFIMILVTN